MAVSAEVVEAGWLGRSEAGTQAIPGAGGSGSPTSGKLQRSWIREEGGETQKQGVQIAEDAGWCAPAVSPALILPLPHLG